MNDDRVRLKEPIAVRWLAMHNNVIAVHKTWPSFVALFTHTDSNATPLAEFITTYKFVAFTALLSDALAIVSKTFRQNLWTSVQ